MYIHVYKYIHIHVYIYIYIYIYIYMIVVTDLYSIWKSYITILLETSSFYGATDIWQ